MSVLYQKLFGTSWVGIIVWESSEEFFAIKVDGDEILADFPARRLFRLPVEIADDIGGTLRWQIPLPPDGLFICLSTRHQGGIDTQCWTSDKQDGFVGHYKNFPVQHEDFYLLMGRYRNRQDDSLFIGQDPRSTPPLFFYERAHQLVRLYPIAPNKFLSERGERFTFSKDENETTLKIESRFGSPIYLERTLPHQEERVLIPTSDGHVLGASLLLPNTPPPHPAVLFCHYADTHFRDYYRLFAECFLQQGIATLIYDKRGWGDSTGDPLFSSIFPLTDDAVAVYEFLQSHPAILSDRVGFWGASNGAWVAPLAASKVKEPAFVIAVSCAGVPPAYQEQVRRVNIVRNLGASADAVALLERMWQLLMDFYVNGTWTEETALVLQQLYENEELQGLPKQKDYGPGLQAVPPIIPIEELKADGGTWAEGGFDPAPVYASLPCPLLFVWGDNDNVIPLEESHQRLETALTAAHHSDFQILRLPDTSHKLYQHTFAAIGLQPSEQETRLHGMRFPAACREHMASWAKHHLH